MDELKSTDLRLGNLIYAIHEESESIRTVDVWWLTTQVEYEENSDADQFSRGWWFAPIELSSDILLKAGANLDEKETFYIGIDDFGANWLELIISTDGYYPVICQAAEMSSETTQQVHLARINYLHQLQNCFYYLSGGTELHINI